MAALFRKQEGEYEEALLLGEADRPMAGERRYAKVGDSYLEDEDAERRKEDRFAELSRGLERAVGERA